MHRSRRVLVLVGSVLLSVGCHDGVTAPALAPAVNAPPAAPAPVASTSPTGAALPVGSYPMCQGQHLASAVAPRTGASEVQLAPAFLDEMAACDAATSVPKAAIPTAEGRINAKGDCEFSNGVSCHYHSGSEFVTTSTSKQTAGQGELHCIFPSKEAKSPQVYGGHIV